MRCRREFHLVSEMHQKVLDVRGGKKDPGANVIVYRKNSPPSKNQLWYVDQQGYMRSALNDFALDASKSDAHFVVKPRLQVRRETGLRCNELHYSCYLRQGGYVIVVVCLSV